MHNSWWRHKFVGSFSPSLPMVKSLHEAFDWFFFSKGKIVFWVLTSRKSHHRPFRGHLKMRVAFDDAVTSQVHVWCDQSTSRLSNAVTGHIFWHFCGVTWRDKMTGGKTNNSGFKSIPFRDIVTFSAEHPQVIYQTRDSRHYAKKLSKWGGNLNHFLFCSTKLRTC